MKKFILHSALLSVILSFPLVCRAEISVIVNLANSDALSESAIKGVFLGKIKTFPSGSQAIPVAQPKDAAASVEFTEKVYKKSAKQLKSYWSKLLFTGQGVPPKEVASDQDVLKLVAENPNIIGYVSSSVVDASVKEVAKF